MLPVNGIFIAVGMVPNTVKVIPDLALDDTGYIKAGEDGRSSVPGIYAVGDVQDKQLSGGNCSSRWRQCHCFYGK